MRIEIMLKVGNEIKYSKRFTPEEILDEDEDSIVGEIVCGECRSRTGACCYCIKELEKEGYTFDWNFIKGAKTSEKLKIILKTSEGEYSDLINPLELLEITDYELLKNLICKKCSSFGELCCKLNCVYDAREGGYSLKFENIETEEME